MLRIREIRDAQGLTLSDLEKVSGFDRATLNLWERGKRSPSIDRAYRLAGALGVTLDDLYGAEREEVEA